MRPYVIVNSAMSLDGRVALKDSDIDFSDRLNDYRIQKLRASVDAIMVDVSVFNKGDPRFEGREIRSSNPTILVIDKGADFPLNASILEEDIEVIIVVSKNASKSKVERLGAKSQVDVVVAGTHTVNLREVMSELYRRQIRKVLVEGDQHLIKRLIEEDYVSELYLTIAPVIVGTGVDFVGEHLKSQVMLNLDGILQYGDQVVLHYLIK